MHHHLSLACRNREGVHFPPQSLSRQRQDLGLTGVKDRVKSVFLLGASLVRFVEPFWTLQGLRKGEGKVWSSYLSLHEMLSVVVVLPPLSILSTKSRMSGPGTSFWEANEKPKLCGDL